MQIRHAILAIVAASAIAVAVFAYLGSTRKLPPSLKGAYGQLETLANSATASLAPPPLPTASAATLEDAGPPPPRVTQAAPLSSAQLGAPLVHGRFVSECGAPDDMKVVVKVTVKKGRAVAVKVTTKPSNPRVAKCIENATRAKEWDVSPATQHATVTY